MTPIKKIRLDVVMVERGLTETRDMAQRLIRAGEVRVDDQVIDTPAKPISPDAKIDVAQPPKYVSRGGFKLEAALDAFGVDPAGFVCADVGSSTGGFSDCLLQRGAAKIFALDVGANQLHWKLRNDPRVVVMEKVNVRHLNALPEPIDLAVIDVSFISLELILPKVFGWMERSAPGALPNELGQPLRALRPQVIALIKPQFEAGREQVGKGGIVRDPAVHAAVVARVVNFAANQGWQASPVIESPITGTQGNKEFLVGFYKKN
ncbi:MAG: TlyA family RNA methyltransferase [Anaerolineae bacterium]|nr:TlyA family RNA methyltransferase [Thermoflexales bacterium]HQW34812.1 TlyA family RNA methyltransferase [Thermoflexales bacterium]